jgi:hypothetical protein
VEWGARGRIARRRAAQARIEAAATNGTGEHATAEAEE